MDLITLLTLTPVRCPHCSRWRSITDFYPDKKKKNGLRSWCKECAKDSNDAYYYTHQEELQAYTREWTRRNPERKKASDAAYRLSHKDELKIYFAQYDLDHREQRQATAWLGHLRRRYHLTPLEYLEILESQGGGCAICGEQPLDKRLHVDHDHGHCPGPNSCGKCIRGLLCFKCNSAIGKFNDDPVLLTAAIDYLESWQLKKKETLSD